VRIASGDAVTDGYGSAVIAATPYWQRLLVLAPAFIIGGGLVLGALIILGRALIINVRESGHKTLIYAGFAVIAVLVAVVTYLGVELPREG